jgi:pimeloyl-ACP methyl ester carboxylesterase
MLRIDESGAGRPVLFLHGMPSPASEMMDLARTISDVWALVPTLPGYAGEAPRPGRHGARAVEASLLEALAARGVSELDVVGYSAGAYRAASLALSGKLRVGRLVLLSPLLGMTADERKSKRDLAAAIRAGAEFVSMAAPAFLAPSRLSDSALRKRVEGWARAVTTETFLEELDDLADLPDLHLRISELAAPVSVRVGALDVVTPVRHAEDIVAKAQRGSLDVVDGVAHAILAEDFEATARWLASSLAAR